MLHLQEFIKNHDNWEELLNKEPYCINIKRKDNFNTRNWNIYCNNRCIINEYK